MILILEDMDNMKKYLKQNYFIDIEEEIEDVQKFRNKIFTSSFYRDAQNNLSYSTLNKYRKILNSCGNNRKKYIKDCVLSMTKSMYKKQNERIK
jgi:hypothetical protein